MRSLKSSFLDTLSLSPQDGSTLKALGEFRGKQELYRHQTPEVLAGLRATAVVESSESSNRIEGIHAAPKRVEALVLRSSTPRNRSEQEIAGYRDALNLIHESGPEMGFSVNVILQLHTMLYRYHPADGGRWKATQNEIVERDPSGKITRVRFAPPGPIETPILMDGLVAEYKRAIQEGEEPAIVIPLAILDFLCIHPFRDGNGRMARLLTLMLLYHFGYEVGRYISLERIIEESKDTYYEALEASSLGWHDGAHNPTPWLNYLWGALIRAYDEFEDRVGTLLSGRGSKTQQIKAAVRRRIEPFSITDIEGDCPGVSRDMVRHVLRQMRDDGLIEVRGRGRGARWHKLQENI